MILLVTGNKNEKCGQVPQRLEAALLMPWCFDSWRFWNSGNRRESGGCPLGEDQQDSHAGDMSRPAVRCHRVRQKCPQQEVST